MNSSTAARASGTSGRRPKETRIPVGACFRLLAAFFVIAPLLAAPLSAEAGNPLPGLDRIFVSLLLLSQSAALLFLCRAASQRDAAEKELRVSEARYRSFAAVSNTGVWEFNQSALYLWCSPEYFEMLGHDPKDFPMDGSPNLSEAWVHLLHPDDQESAMEVFIKYLENGSPGMYENTFRMRHASGDWVWIWSRGQTIRNADGTPSDLTVGTHIDVTERRTIMEKIKRSRRTYREIFDNIADALFIHDIETGAILDVNESMLRQFGYTREELPELTVESLSALEEPYTDRHARELIRRAANGETVVFEWLNRRKNGELFYSENILKPVVLVGTERIMAIVREITDRKQAEDALRESEAKLAALFEAMTELVVLHELVFDGDGEPANYRITDCNAAFTKSTGIPREAAVGRLATDLYGSAAPPYMEEFSKVALTGEPRVFETYFAPMEKHFLISAVSPRENAFATITADITAIKRAEKLVEAKNRELEQLIYVTSHDLRSPLVNIDGYGRELQYSVEELEGALRAEGLSPEERAEALRALVPDFTDALLQIRNSTRRMDVLLAGLLKLSRMGRAALVIGPVDANKVLEETLSSMQFQIKEAGASVRVGELPSCLADAVQLGQVFANLLGNALKYLDPGRPGEISIEGEIEGNRAVYRVEDNGIGIAPEHLENIFEIFHRLDPSAGEGEGLGLTIVKRILGRLDGEIRVDSAAGKGSVFRVALPLPPKGGEGAGDTSGYSTT